MRESSKTGMGNAGWSQHGCHRSNGLLLESVNSLDLDRSCVRYVCDILRNLNSGSSNSSKKRSRGLFLLPDSGFEAEAAVASNRAAHGTRPPPDKELGLLIH